MCLKEPFHSPRNPSWMAQSHSIVGWSTSLIETRNWNNYQNRIKDMMLILWRYRNAWYADANTDSEKPIPNEDQCFRLEIQTSCKITFWSPTSVKLRTSPQNIFNVYFNPQSSKVLINPQYSKIYKLALQLIQNSILIPEWQISVLVPHMENHTISP